MIAQKATENPALNSEKTLKPIDRTPEITELMDNFVAIADEIKERRLLIGYYYSLNYLCNRIDHGEQPKQITPNEKDFILTLAKDAHFNLSEIALVTDRSKSSIHNVLVSAGITSL